MHPVGTRLRRSPRRSARHPTSPRASPRSWFSPYAAPLAVYGRRVRAVNSLPYGRSAGLTVRRARGGTRSGLVDLRLPSAPRRGGAPPRARPEDLCHRRPRDADHQHRPTAQCRAPHPANIEGPEQIERAQLLRRVNWVDASVTIITIPREGIDRTQIHVFDLVRESSIGAASLSQLRLRRGPRSPSTRRR
jgi:hypothetical protein